MEFQSKSDVVAAALRESIITGELEAGAPLRQRDLAEQFGVSATPVREALRRLEAEGLVDYDLHRGATVIQASMGASEENYEIRAALESLAARLAATRMSDEDLERLRSLHEQMLACAQDDPRVVELNRRFHFEIYTAARSPMLLALLRLLWGSFPFPRGPQLDRPVEESCQQHAEILDALRRGEPDEAERLVRAHILGALPYLAAERSTSEERHASHGREVSRAR